MHSRIFQHSPVAPLRGLTPVLRPPGHGRCRIEPDLGQLRWELSHASRYSLMILPRSGRPKSADFV
jgi:hypothetical protein